MEHVIAFPGLGLEFTLNSVAFTIFGKEIYWYGLIICVGFILGSIYISRHAQTYGFTQDNVFDCILICVPLSIVCARAYYVIFQWDNYKDNLIEIFNTRNGGIAIYGGVIGALLGLVIYAKWKKLRLFDMCDLAAPGLLIGQGIGRWGNFVNAEAFGSETDLPWRMTIGGGAGVHPTFLYESIWNLVGVIVLWRWSKKRRFSGEIALGYLAWYGFGRMFIEGLRTDSLYFFSSGLRVSQVLAAVTCVLAIYLIVRGYRAHPRVAIDPAITLQTEPEEAPAPAAKASQDSPAGQEKGQTEKETET